VTPAVSASSRICRARCVVRRLRQLAHCPCRCGSCVRAASSRSRARGTLRSAPTCQGDQRGRRWAKSRPRRTPNSSHPQASASGPKPGVKYRGVVPLHVSAASAKLSLHVGGKDSDAAHHSRRGGRIRSGACRQQQSSHRSRHGTEALKEVDSGRCRLVVLGKHTGGRWCPEAATFLRLLARCRARSAPHHCRVNPYLLTCFSGSLCSPLPLPAPDLFPAGSCRFRCSQCRRRFLFFIFLRVFSAPQRPSRRTIGLASSCQPHALT